MNQLRAARIALVVTLIYIALPAVADHIIEPTGPITEYEMEIYSYPHVDTRLTACDGTEVLRKLDGTIATDARIETFPDSPSRENGNPSEHWDEKVTIFVVLNFEKRNEMERYRFQSAWQHANIAPHAHGGILDHGPESSQDPLDLTQFPTGTILRVRAELDTRTSGVSGQVLTNECTFRAG